MKPWYKKKKVWASILGALAVVLTIFLAPADVDQAKVIAAAVLEAAVAIGFVTAEAGIDKASAKSIRIHNHYPKPDPDAGDLDLDSG